MNLNFSVLLSVYKKENPFFLEQALQSISEKQSVKPNEIIIIRDGLLTDSLDIILNNFLIKYPNIIKIFGYEKNKGLGYALNYGLNKCSNEIVFRMDTDDICVSDRFEKQLRIFNDHPDLVLVGGLIEEFNSKPHDLNRFRHVPSSSQEINNKKFYRNPFNHMTIAFLKSSILKCGGYKPMAGYEDYYLWMRVLKEFNGFNLPDTLVHARVGNGMITRRQGFVFFANEFKFQRTLLAENLITNSAFIKNIFFRLFPRLLPKKILELIYTKILRN
jgi:glycosyltransferase involved in cell wall biosynthesis